jgi:DNA-binding NtrC family response regulator
MDGGAVLIVEDDADVRRSARIALSGYTSRVDEFESGQGLSERVRAFEYEAILLDMNFAAGQRNGVAGLDALAAVRAVDPTLSVVLMTSYGGVTLAVDALKRGGVDFILKPWRNEKLVAAVVEAIELTRTRRGVDTLELEAVEREAIARALERFDHNISHAAAALGLSRAALYRRMAKHGFQTK